MGFWDIAGKVGGAAFKVGKAVASEARRQAELENKRMKDPRYREAKKNLRELRECEQDMIRANKELDEIMRD